MSRISESVPSVVLRHWLVSCCRLRLVCWSFSCSHWNKYRQLFWDQLSYNSWSDLNETLFNFMHDRNVQLLSCFLMLIMFNRGFWCFIIYVSMIMFVGSMNNYWASKLLWKTYMRVRFSPSGRRGELWFLERSSCRFLAACPGEHQTHLCLRHRQVKESFNNSN